jgi:hypothetical protein
MVRRWRRIGCRSIPLFPHELITAVGIIPYGKGKIIFSTFDICGNLDSKKSSANVACKLPCNFIEYGIK